jgi:hypothetical protein
MSPNIDALRDELARVRRPVRFWTGMVVTLSFVFLGEVALVVAQNVSLHRPVIVMKQPKQEPAVLVVQPQLQPMPQPQPTVQPQPQPEAHPQPQRPVQKPNHRIDVSAPVCPASDPICGIDGA